MRILTFCLLFMIGCSETSQEIIDDIVSSYITETETKKVSHITVKEIEYNELDVYRIFSNLVFYKDELPTGIKRIKGYEVLFYQLNKPKIDSSQLSKELLKSRDKYRDEGMAVFYNPDEWIVAICRSSPKYKLIKHTAHLPIDEIQELEKINCN